MADQAKTTEVVRLAELARCGVLDSPPEPCFDRTVRLAAQLLGAPAAVLGLLGSEREQFKARFGVELADVPRAQSLSELLLQRGDALVVADAQEDPALARLPLVAHTGARRLAAIPVRLSGGHLAGTLAVLDPAPGEPAPEQLEELEAVAQVLVAQIEARREYRRALAEERERLEAEVRLLQTLTHEISGAADLEKALHATLQAVCLATGFEHGEAWSLVPGLDRRLRLAAATRATPALAAFADASAARSFGPGEGLPGRAHAARAPEWISDFSSGASGLSRMPEALAAGLAAGFAIPIADPGSPVEAVLCFFTRAPKAEDSRTVRLVSSVAAQLAVLLARKHAEETLQLLESAAQSSTESIIVTDARFEESGPHIVYVNRGFVRMTGYEPAEALGRSPIELLKLPDGEKSLRELRERTGRGEGFHGEGRAARKDGSRFVLEWSISPVRDAAGAVTHFVSVQRDITVRRRIEEALHRSEKAFRSLIEASPDAVVVSRQGRVVYGNPALAALVGRRHVADLVGTSVAELFGTDPGAGIAGSPGETSARRPEPAREIKLQHADGSHRVAEVTSLPVILAEAPAVMSIARDVTERRELDARLRVADRMTSVGTLAAGVAHEINNPLSYVIANLAHLQERLQRARDRQGSASGVELTSYELQEFVEVLGESREGADRVRRIVRDLRTFAGQDDDRRDAVDLRAILETALNMATNEIRHRAKLIRRYDRIPAVLGSESRLAQVFVNLLVNAAQAIPEGKAAANEIIVATSTDGRGRAVVEIGDTGVGIPPEHLARVFEPFFTTKAVGVGTGLGLSVVHNTLTALGADISLRSEPGKGTTFTITFPPHAVESADEGRQQASPAEERTRVLVVDDEPLIGKTVRRILSAHEVVTLTAADDALSLLARGERFDAIICDVMMPEMSGPDFHEAVRRLDDRQAGRMIFITGGAFTERSQAFLASVPNARLEKPFDPAQLRGTVATVIEDRARGRAGEV